MSISEWHWVVLDQCFLGMINALDALFEEDHCVNLIGDVQKLRQIKTLVEYDLVAPRNASQCHPPSFSMPPWVKLPILRHSVESARLKSLLNILS